MVQFEIPDPLPQESALKTKPMAFEPAIDAGDCLKCHKNKIAFECDPCGCPCFCADCAPKLASGGKCKTCKSFYGGLRRLRQSS